MNKISLLGKRFGRLRVVCETPIRSDGRFVVWQCHCDCGNTVSVSSRSLISGNTNSCGCLHKEIVSKQRALNLTGQKFGLLTALTCTEKRKASSRVWLCLCDCGQYKEVSAAHLVRGSSRSCGCLLHKDTILLYAFVSKLHDLIKIGITKNVMVRLKTLETSLNDCLLLVGYKKSTTTEEKQVLSRLLEFRMPHPNNPKVTEWFQNNPYVFEYVRSLF